VNCSVVVTVHVQVGLVRCEGSYGGNKLENGWMTMRGIRYCMLGLAMCIVLTVTGCTTVVFGAARLIREDRSAENHLTDTQIAAGMLSSLAEKDKNLLLDVNVDAWEMRVLLTGTVSDTKTRQEVVQMARADKRIKKVYDEIQIISTDDQARRREAVKNKDKSAPDKADPIGTDFWIETKISAQLVSTPDVVSVNYRWRSVRRTVYLIGRAQNKTEWKTVMDVVSATKGVAQVISFVEIKPI
jgi:osmotically-inducible protein OsmY